MSLQINWTAGLFAGAALTLLGLLLQRLGRGRPDPVLGFSSLEPFKGFPQSGRLRWIRLPRLLLALASLALLLTVADLHFLVEEELELNSNTEATEEPAEEKYEEFTLPTEGIAIYLVLDQSGSMTQEVTLTTDTGRRVRLQRMDALKQVTAQFVKGNRRAGLGGRDDDLIGLVSFARVPHVLSPLTLDHDYLLEVLSQLQTVKRREEDGTGIGYAIYKTAHLISATRHFAEELEKEGKPAYAIKNTVMILVTDGFHYPNPMDQGHKLRTVEVLEAAQYAQEQGIKVYIVNIEPALAQPKYAGELDVLRRAANVTGGELFVTGQEGTLTEIYTAIDAMEGSALPEARRVMARVKEDYVDRGVPKALRKVPLAPYFLSAALACLFFSVLLDTTYLRRIP